MFVKKSEITVREACRMAYEKMPEIFSAIKFCALVRMITKRPSLMDGTTLRRLREIRAESIEYQYRCIDPEKAMYKKIPY
jgi:hypothetical protein